MQDGLRKVASQTTEQTLQKQSARFENVCARSAAHLARTASSAAKVAQTDGSRRGRSMAHMSCHGAWSS
eukprot:5461210-Prymnesium_polylepis.1